MNIIGVQVLASAWVVIYVLAALFAATHALLHKRDPRSAWGWIAVCWLFPLAGAILYAVFGVNRIDIPADPLRAQRRDACDGNRVTPLYNGEQAYPAMLEAISSATTSIYLATYIFSVDAVGRQFAQALSDAQSRGVRVRVLIDGASDLFYRPRASTLLKRLGIPHALFLPLKWWPPSVHVNLRNHRKLLVVDQRLAFCGGMNLAEHHLVRGVTSNPVADLHFRIEGPVVEHLSDVFHSDWQFAGRETLPQEALSSISAGQVKCRPLTDGPDHHNDPFMLVMMVALASARHKVRIMTPYFLPPAPIVAALEATALRGVTVEVLIPGRSNHRWVDWATRHTLTPLLEHGVRVHLGGLPFDHTKLLLIDDHYVQFGSANLDVRSMRLNFELNVECYDEALSTELGRHFEQRALASRSALVTDLASRTLLARLRDALCWLFSPYF